MSTLALMRFLESAPSRYDRGMRWLTLGRADDLRDAVARAALAAARPGEAAVVLEIGCGTGALTERLVRGGARVTAVDQSPEMLEMARARGLKDVPGIELLERTAAEIEALPREGFDAVVSAFALSEMSASERDFVLRRAWERLRPGGVLAIADEVRPRSALGRAIFAAVRGPQALLAWLLVGSVSHALPALAEEIEAAGFRLRDETRWLGGHLAVAVAERPA